MERKLVGSIVISQICEELGYTRSHVANILRDNHRKLKAKRVGRRWVLPSGSKKQFKTLVRQQSGPRRKLGERGSAA